MATDTGSPSWKVFQMPKVQFESTELVGTRVNFVSLVKRGANRIPFRIVKEDKDMMDLYKIGRNLFQKTEAAPQIVAAIIKDGADINAIAALFKQAGLDPKTFQKAQGEGFTTVSVEGYADLTETSVVKMSDDFAIVVTGLQKGFKDWDFDGSSFAEVLKVSGHYSSMRTAMEAFSEVARTALYDSDNPAAAASAVSKAADEFKQYVVSLTGALPVHAFKMEQALAKEAAKNGTGEGVEAGKGTGTNAKATEDDKKNTILKEAAPFMSDEDKKKMKEKEDAEAAKKSEDTMSDEDKKKMKAKEMEEAKKAAIPVPAPTGDDLSTGFANAPTDSAAATARATADDKKQTQNGAPLSGSSIPDGDSGLGAVGGLKKEEVEALLKASLDTITGTLAALAKSIEGLSGLPSDLKKLGDRVDSVAAQARKTEEALNGTVFNDASGDAAKIVKNEASKSAPPLLDTAYGRDAA